MDLYDFIIILLLIQMLLIFKLELIQIKQLNLFLIQMKNMFLLVVVLIDLFVNGELNKINLVLNTVIYIYIIYLYLEIY